MLTGLGAEVRQGSPGLAEVRNAPPKFAIVLCGYLRVSTVI